MNEASPADDPTPCIARVLEGDDAAARELVERLHPLVLRIVRSRLPRFHSEEDMTQEVFMKVFANLGTFQGAVPFHHWVSRIAVNACLNRLRAEKIRPELRWADLDEAQAAVIERAVAGHEPGRAEGRAALEVVEKLFAALSAPDRLLLQRLELEDRSVAEVERETGWSATYIRVRAFRARRLLNRKFGKLWKEGRL